MNTPAISFVVSDMDERLIRAIAIRAVADGIVPERESLDRTLDLLACHANAYPLRLQDLLDAPTFDFAHDILGIRRHLDRETGKLKDCFVPRYFDHTRRQA